MNKSNKINYIKDILVFILNIFIGLSMFILLALSDEPSQGSYTNPIVFYAWLSVLLLIAIYFLFFNYQKRFRYFYIFVVAYCLWLGCLFYYVNYIKCGSYFLGIEV